MDGISGWIDSSSQISPFDFSFDTSSQEQSQGRNSKQTEQSSRFDSVIADALSLSPEALEKAKVLQRNDAVAATENSQTQRQFQNSLADTPYGALATSYTNTAATYTAAGRIQGNEQDEMTVTKGPQAEELRRVPYAQSPDLSHVAAMYAGNVSPQDNLQTRTFTPSNGSSAYEAVRLRSLDGARPTSVHINDVQSTSLAKGSNVSPQKASAAYQSQYRVGNPGSDLAPPVYTGRWSIGVDLRV